MAGPSQIGGSTVSSSLSSRSYPVTAVTSPGDTLLATVSVNNTTCTVSALTDSQGNLYTLDRSFTTSSPMMYAFRCPGATGGSGGGATAALATSDTWTLTTAASSGNVELIAATAGKVAAVDQISSIATGTSASPSVSATPGFAGETCIAGFVTANGGGAPSVSSPFTSIGSWSNGTNPYNTMTYDVLAGGSGAAQTSALTITSANWRGVMWTFQAGPAAGSAALSGSGTLSAAEKAGWSAALSGQGSLTPGGGFRSAVSLSGSGTLTPGGKFRGATGMSGTGSLAASGIKGDPAALSGSGTLSAVPSVVGTLVNSFEGGTDGTAISTANSGGLSGNAWDSLGGSVTLPSYTSSGAINGTLGGATPLSGNSTTTLEWKESFAWGFNSSSVPWYARDYFKIASLPPLIVRLMKAQDDAAPQDVWAICMDTTGKLGIRDLVGGAWQGQATTAVSTGAKNRYECSVSYDGSAYSIALRCFYGANFNGTTPDETVTGSVSNSNPVNVAAFGAQTATPQTWSGIVHDSIGLTNAGWLGPDTSRAATAILAGTGTLGLAAATIGAAAALTGSGALISSPLRPGLAALAGFGTLTPAARLPGALSLSGAGVLGAVLIIGPHAALSGSGALTAGLILPNAAPMSGTGTLSAAEKIGWAAAMSGSGTLSGIVTGFPFAVLSGSGTLGVSTGVFVAGSVLAGAGSLGLVPAFSPVLAMTGQGSFSSSPLFGGAAALAGSGSLASSPLLLAAAALSGSGSLAGAPVRPGLLALSGQGTLAAAGVRTFNALAALAGSGTLAAARVLTIPGAAALAGQGQLSSAGAILVPLSMTGSGVLTVHAGVTFHALVSMLGSGSFSALGIVPVSRSGAMSGTGTLTANWTAAPPGPDWFWNDYQKKRDAALRLWQFWREAKSTGDPITAGPAFIKAYQADALADAAYALWQQVSGSDLPIQ